MLNSSLLNFPAILPLDTQFDFHNALRVELQCVQRSENIQEVISVSQIINPVEEQVDDSGEQIVEHIFARYAPGCNAESDEEDEPQRLVSTNKALDALDVLYLYEAQQETKDSLRLFSFCAWRQDLVHCQSPSKKQTVLDTYFHSLS